ncbi:MAG: hypothetical protein QOG63_2245 [Thermoleophilaceae bacterium]|jgi:hypothetical protein|nr:hypothetical protein [Thermoleophilaceae bacterium]
MKMKNVSRAAVAAAVLAAGSTAAVTSAAPTHSAATPKITAAGVGKVKLDKSYRRLRAQGLVGKIGPGCEAAGPKARSAKLKAPLTGSVDFTLNKPRKVANITVRGGATARGVGIGSTIGQIKAKFPTAETDHSAESTFGVTIVRIPAPGDKVKFQFAVSTKTHKTTEVGIPDIQFCD